MAEQHAETAYDHVHGQMEIAAQESMFKLFISMTKWCSLAMAALILMLTVWFAVGAGFIAGALSAIVVTAVGIVLWRDKKTAEH